MKTEFEVRNKALDRLEFSLERLQGLVNALTYIQTELASQVMINLPLAKENISREFKNDFYTYKMLKDILDAAMVLHEDKPSVRQNTQLLVYASELASATNLLFMRNAAWQANDFSEYILNNMEVEL